MVNPVINMNEEFLTAFGYDLQADLFTSRRKDHTLLLFLAFNTDSDQIKDVKEVLAGLANNSPDRKGLYLTSYHNQLAIDSNRENDRNLFINVFLTSRGLRKLGYGNSSWKEYIFGQDKWKQITEHLDATQDDLSASDRSRWDEDYRQHAGSVDAVMLLGHNTADALVREERQLKSQIFDRIGIKILFRETGRVYRERSRDPDTPTRGIAVEHFGYADGGSNPCVTARDFKKFQERHQTMQHWNPVTSIDEFVVEEPGTVKAYGSYLVYRKIEQDVGKFYAVTDELARQMDISGEEAGALVFGKRRDGTSLQQQGKIPRKHINDFYYTQDSKCPVFAHARKMNPRDGMVGQSRGFQYPNPIMRRGITYGNRSLKYDRLSAVVPESASLGLLFLSYQNKITRYQQILQDAQKDSHTLDPILSTLLEPEKEISHQIPGLEEPFEGLGGFVTMKGGLNLYVPSIHFFNNL